LARFVTPGIARYDICHLIDKSWSFTWIRLNSVDLKYITHTQVVEVIYEGHTRQFCVISVSSAGAVSNGDVDLTEGLESLTIQSKPQVWTVGWDSSVRILDNHKNSDGPDIAHKVFLNTTIISK
jgi:AAA family ATPase